MSNEKIHPEFNSVIFKIENIGFVSRDLRIDIGFKEEISGPYIVLIEDACKIIVPKNELNNYTDQIDIKRLWWKLYRYMRPMLYFMYRIFFKLRILDGHKGIIFHFLQGFWFRLIVDIKIDEILNQPKAKAQTTVYSFNNK
jgi:hypothetical protein